jgi:hypothetical protein
MAALSAAAGTIHGMTPDEILDLATSMPGAAVNGQRSQRCARGQLGRHVLLFRPDGNAPGNRRFPFATVVTNDYDGFDTASNLDRPGIFRLNIAVGGTSSKS